MEIREINENKKEYLELLLLADEQESMIDRYLERGEMYVLYDAGEVRAVCVVTQENDQILELKNLAVKPQCQRRGYGRKMIQFLCEKYRGKKAILQVGTGDSRQPCLFMRDADSHNHIGSPDFLWITTTIRS